MLSEFYDNPDYGIEIPGNGLSERDREAGVSRFINVSLEDRDRLKNGRNVLFNDVLNIFCLRLYGVRHMVKYHSDGDRNPAAATTWATLLD